MRKEILFGKRRCLFFFQKNNATGASWTPVEDSFFALTSKFKKTAERDILHIIKDLIWIICPLPINCCVLLCWKKESEEVPAPYSSIVNWGITGRNPKQVEREKQLSKAYRERRLCIENLDSPIQHAHKWSRWRSEWLNYHRRNPHQTAWGSEHGRGPFPVQWFSLSWLWLHRKSWFRVPCWAKEVSVSTKKACAFSLLWSIRSTFCWLIYYKNSYLISFFAFDRASICFNFGQVTISFGRWQCVERK